MTKARLRNAILAVNLVDVAIMLYLASVRGPAVIGFAVAGLFVSVFYVAPPIRLKHHAAAGHAALALAARWVVGEVLEQVELGDDADRAAVADHQKRRGATGELTERLGQ